MGDYRMQSYWLTDEYNANLLIFLYVSIILKGF